VDRLFLDANVLFSAAYRDRAGLLRFWELPDVQLITSSYAMEEARANLDAGLRRTRLDGLAKGLSILARAPRDRPLPEAPGLPAKDRPILLAAIEGGASHLVTGDIAYFGRWMGKVVHGVKIVRPAAYLAGRK
jgi:predicted nucleic acid-binding protein